MLSMDHKISYHLNYKGNMFSISQNLNLEFFYLKVFLNNCILSVFILFHFFY
jgi:hypothetical protein